MDDRRRRRRHRSSSLSRSPFRDSHLPDDDDDGLADYIKAKIKPKTIDSLGRTGGIYVPPFKMAELEEKCNDNSSTLYQRKSWEALRKSIHGLVNKINIQNVASLVQDLFHENLIRGRGLVCRAIIRAQMASPGFTHIYSCLVSILNSKLPELGDLIIRRVILQFRRAYHRNDKIVCVACVKFIAHLINQKVVSELLALQLAMLLLEKLTDDSIDICVSFLLDVGQCLREISPVGFNAIYDRLRAILHEGSIDKRVQYPIEDLFRVISSNFADYPGVMPELDLVEESDQITHQVDLLEEVHGDEMLNVFKELPADEFIAGEEAWNKVSSEILGIGDEDQDSAEDEELQQQQQEEASDMIIKDNTKQDIIQLRKTVYLTIMSSAHHEECIHKILKLNIAEQHEIEVCTMLIDCNAMERTFQPFYCLQAERLCKLRESFKASFELSFARQYETIHRLETNKLRSTAKFFAHLLRTDAIPWSCMAMIKLSEESTTSASRIFIKIIFQELTDNMGLSTLFNKLQEQDVAPHVGGIFPTENPHHIRFCVNFFTAIGLSGLTQSLREILCTSE